MRKIFLALLIALSVVSLSFAQTITKKFVYYPVVSTGGSGGSVVATDAFTRSDGTLGSNWTSLYLTGTYPMMIVGNKANANGSGTGIEYAFWNANSFNNNQYAKGRMAAAYTFDKCGVICRATTNNYYYAYAYYTGGGNAEFGKVVGGTKTVFSSAITTTLALTDTIKIIANGTTISWYINSTLKETITDASLASGAAGIVIDNTSGAGAIDDWEGGNL